MKLFSIDNYRKIWNTVKEYTPSGVSELHFGHWKGGCTNDYITDVHAICISTPYTTGYPPKRCQQGMNIMM